MAVPAIFAQLMEKFVEFVWPWIVKHIWPILQKHIVDIVAFLISWAMQRTKDAVNDQGKKRSEEASAKADDAEQRATKADNQSEIERLRAEAQIWREVARQHSQDIEILKKQISEIESDTSISLIEEVSEINPKLHTRGDGLELALGDSKHLVPAISTETVVEPMLHDGTPMLPRP